MLVTLRIKIVDKIQKKFWKDLESDFYDGFFSKKCFQNSDIFWGPGAYWGEGRIPSKAGDIALSKAGDFAKNPQPSQYYYQSPPSPP